MSDKQFCFLLPTQKLYYYSGFDSHERHTPTTLSWTPIKSAHPVLLYTLVTQQEVKLMLR